MPRSRDVLSMAVGFALATGGQAGAPQKIVALELFTSQGCSSCPPAERVFQALADDPDLPAGVVPLAFHVPYWDYIGWPDPYSDAAFEARQRAYGQAFASRRIYTPQLVVNGKAHRVGPHDRSTLERVVAAAARPVPGALQVKARRKGRELRVEASVELAEELSGSTYELVAVAYHHASPTSVRRGENTGRTLHNPWTVRAMARVASGPGTRGSQIGGQVTLRLPQDMLQDEVGVAVLLQDRATREVVHAGRVPVPRG